MAKTCISCGSEYYKPHNVGCIRYIPPSKEEVLQDNIVDLTKKVADLKFALVLASVGSCTCITKTDDYRFHGENCRYRIIQQALAAAEKE